MIFHQQGTRGRLAFSNISDQVFVAKFDTKTMDDLVFPPQLGPIYFGQWPFL